MSLPQSPTWDTAVFRYEIMDLSNVSSNIMTTSSDDDIPDLEDISGHLNNLQDWLHEHFLLILPEIKITLL